MDWGLVSNILAGCGDSTEKVHTLDTEIFSEKSTDIEEEYKKLNNEGKADAVVFKYSKDFMEAIDRPKIITDGFVREYSRAVKILFQKKT